MSTFYLHLSSKSGKLKVQLLIVPQKCEIKEMVMSKCDSTWYSCISKIDPNLFSTDYIYVLVDNFAHTLTSSQLQSFQ